MQIFMTQKSIFPAKNIFARHDKMTFPQIKIFERKDEAYFQKKRFSHKQKSDFFRIYFQFHLIENDI